MLEFYSLLCTEICILTVTVIPYSSVNLGFNPEKNTTSLKICLKHQYTV